MFLKAREQVSVGNLLHGLLTLSGNDAAVVLAEGIAGSEAKFTGLMNAEARKLGMKDSNFGTANGWPDEGRTYSTAHDLTLLAQHIINDDPAFFRDFFSQREFRWGNVTQPNRNPLLGAIEGADGMKTGHSDEAGYCLVGTVQQGKRRIVMVIAGLPTQAARLTEARRFAQWGFEAWRDRYLYKRNSVVTRIPVQLGEESSVALMAPRDLAAVLPKTSGGQLSFRVRYNGPARAPFRKGTELAQLLVKLPDGSQQVMPLVAARTVTRAGFMGRAWNGAKSLFGA
jgi:serine-type D-Ala-D-Ala carboxypeptidase (penicillin-binding protein 5/6)